MGVQLHRLELASVVRNVSVGILSARRSRAIAMYGWRLA